MIHCPYLNNCDSKPEELEYCIDNFEHCLCYKFIMGEEDLIKRGKNLLEKESLELFGIRN